MTAPAWFLPVAAFLFGAVIGSFLNVCIHRIPGGRSIVSPPSACPACGGRIRPRDNVPILSWLALRGRCRDCGAPISPRYLLVEGLTAALFALYAWKLGPVPALFPWLVLVSASIVIFFIDLEHMIIPDSISLPGIAVGLAFTPLLPRTLIEGLIGMAGGALFFLLVYGTSLLILRREGMGVGDIKMAALMGAFLGWKLLLVAVMLALLTGSAAGLLLMALGKRGRKDAIPFGPFLALGTVATGLAGEELARWYLNLLQ